MKFEFLDIAQKELDDSFEYYEFQQKKLGYRFIDEVIKSLERIKFFPHTWQKITTNTRRCLVKNFPYGVIYKIYDEKILIVAIANLHRKPNYWKDRIEDKNIDG
jgi:hypothetical protein